MALRIGFDLDGVLADMESALVRESETLFGKALPRQPQEPAAEAGGVTTVPDEAAAGSSEADSDLDPPVLRLNLTPRQQQRLWRHVASIENFWESLDELEPGLVQRLAGLAADRRWEIIFLTKRPETLGATAQVQTQRWLESKGFPLPSVFVVQRSRGRIASSLGLDVVVDDRAQSCLNVVMDSSARAILIWRGGEHQVPAVQRLGIGIAKSVADCLEILAQLDSAGRDEPGVLGRVMRRLGLKDPT